MIILVMINSLYFRVNLIFVAKFNEVINEHWNNDKEKKTLLDKNCIIFMSNKSFTSILLYCPIDMQPKVNLDLIPIMLYKRCINVSAEWIDMCLTYLTPLLHFYAPLRTSEISDFFYVFRSIFGIKWIESFFLRLL